ncbi:hypothetical protein ACWFRF_15595 [Nocardia sp. NPDC055165]
MTDNLRKAIEPVWIHITDPAHPHYNEYGILEPENKVMYGAMTSVRLDNCKHGTNGCYVMSKQYEVIQTQLEGESK